mgnify:CR=1 FL=1
MTDTDELLYGTHHMVLKALGVDPRIRRVVEFGGGRYSTSYFLRRDVFYHLVSLVTVETNACWRRMLKAWHEDDNRWLLADTREEGLHLSEYEPSGWFAFTDVVLIDDGVTPQQRVDTIAALNDLMMQPYTQFRGVVVIHDYENPLYANEARKFWQIEAVFDAVPPYTAMLAMPFTRGEAFLRDAAARLNLPVEVRYG